MDLKVPDTLSMIPSAWLRFIWWKYHFAVTHVTECVSVAYIFHFFKNHTFTYHLWNCLNFIYFCLCLKFLRLFTTFGMILMHIDLSYSKKLLSWHSFITEVDGSLYPPQKSQAVYFQCVWLHKTDAHKACIDAIFDMTLRNSTDKKGTTEIH